MTLLAGSKQMQDKLLLIADNFSNNFSKKLGPKLDAGFNEIRRRLLKDLKISPLFCN